MRTATGPSSQVMAHETVWDGGSHPRLMTARGRRPRIGGLCRGSSNHGSMSLGQPTVVWQHDVERCAASWVLPLTATIGSGTSTGGGCRCCFGAQHPSTKLWCGSDRKCCDVVFSSCEFSFGRVVLCERGGREADDDIRCTSGLYFL